MLQLFNGPGLALPSRAPGFSSEHSASANIRFSGVSVGANFISLLNGQFGVIQGGGFTGFATGVVHGNVGPSLVFTNNNALLQFGGFPSTSPNAVTLAAIAVPTAADIAANFAVLLSNSGNGPNGEQLILQAGQLQFNVWGGNRAQPDFGRFQASAGVPYFFAASASQTQVNFAMVNLLTGSVDVDKNIGSFTGLGSNDSNVTLGTFPGANNDGFTGNLARIMCNESLLSFPDLLGWAADPWSFWHPPIVENLIFASLAQPTSPIIVPSSLGMTIFKPKRNRWGH